MSTAPTPESASQFVTTKLHKLHYYGAGKGQPIVMLHGGGPGATGCEQLQPEHRRPLLCLSSDGSARAAAPRQAPPQRAATAASGARNRTVAPARSTPAVLPGRTKPVPTVVAQPARTDNEGPSHQSNRGPHKAVDATRGQAGHHKQATRGETKHVAESHHQKQHQNQGQKQSPNGHAYGHQEAVPERARVRAPEAAPEAGPEGAPEAGPEGAREAGPEAAREAVTEAGPEAHVQQRH